MRGFYFLIFFFPLVVFSQQQFLQLNHNANIDINKQLNYSNHNIHTGFRPLLESHINKSLNIDSLQYGYQRDSIFLSGKKHTWFWRKLRAEDFILVDTSDFFLAINPLFDIQMGFDQVNDSSLRVNTRGVMVKGNIGDKLSFYTDFYENQAFFPDYVYSYTMIHGVVPGQGRTKLFKGSGNDYAYASGYLSFSPNQWLNFHAGHGKNFIGEGYRSLLLSDFSFNYPFIKATLTFNKFQYTSMFTSHQEIRPADSRLLAYNRKHGTFNYLNWIVNKRIQVGLFEGIIWKTTYENTNNKFDPNYFNPVMMIRPLQYGLGDENNIILGLNSKVKIIKSIQLYGQYVLDDFDNKYTNIKYGYQVGIKLFEIFKMRNLYLQAEFNTLSPYTYGHINPSQNYSNANEALAHPLGANFNELIGIANYKFKDFFINIKYISANTVNSIDVFNTGDNIFLSDSLSITNINSLLPLSVESKLTYFSCTVGYLINPRYNFQIFAGYINRRVINNFEDHKTNYITLGVRASLVNHYYDF